MTKTIFNRNDAAVQSDATSLSLEDFQAKYKDRTTAIILKTVWNTANKNKATATQVEKKTTKANDLPGKKEPITNVAVSDKALPASITSETSTEASDGSTISVARSDDNKTVIVSVDNTGVEEKEAASAGTADKKTKKGKKETAVATGPTSPTGKPTRAVRLRELIAAGKDKKASVEVLTAEGYDVKTIHSEWNRLNKPTEEKK